MTPRDRKPAPDLRQWISDFLTAWRLHNSGWVVPDWYWQVYPEECVRVRRGIGYRLGRTRLPLINRVGRFFAHPAWHYVRSGAAANLNPSIWFDTAAYRAAFPEVDRRRLNPLRHYLDSNSDRCFPAGSAPGISPAAAARIRAESEARLGVTDADTLPESPLPPGRIAVHLHLYYPSMAPYWAKVLARIPADFDLYVSLPPHEMPETAAAAFRSLRHLRCLTAEPVPNRGRNFGPLLLQFGSRLADYDFVCHVHTKRSPHAPQLADWGRRLADGLLADPKHITRILGCLAGDGKFVYQALPQRWNPDPLTGWNANWEPASRLTLRLGMNPGDLPPVIEFPHGGMFWTRGEVLRLAAQLPLHWEDFPEEPIPPDGTVAHAVERLLLFWSRDLPGRCYRLRGPAASG